MPSDSGVGGPTVGQVWSKTARPGQAAKDSIRSTPVIPVLLVAFGGYLAWFGVHYWRSDMKWPSDPIKDVLRGQALPEKGQIATSADILTEAYQNASGGASNASGSIVTNSAIANDAQTYIGQGYVWGGKADVPGDWDCSSFVSYVLGHDFSMQLPGGGHYGDAGYPPHSHGPATEQYALYGTGISRSAVKAGDLVVWPTEHIGIAISNSQMVSARSEHDNPPTGLNTIDGDIPGLSPVFRRVPGTANILPTPSGTTSPNITQL